MKKLIVSIISCLVVVGMISSCRKVDNPKLPSISRVPLPLLTDSLYPGDQLLPAAAAFTRTVTVDVYFKEDVPPKSMDLVIVKNGSATNYSASSIKVLHAGITTFPATVTFTDADIQSLFGTPVALGDIYEVGANVTAKDGTVYPAYTAGTYKPGTDTVNLPGGSAYGADIASLAGSNVSLTYKAPCKFDASVFVGDYQIVEDDWADYSNLPKPAPPVVLGPASNQLTLNVYPGVGAGTNRKPMIVTIDTTNAGGGNAVVPLQTIGDYGADANAGARTNANATKSYVDFCTGEIHLYLDFVFPAPDPDAGTYAGFTLDMTH